MKQTWTIGGGYGLPSIKIIKQKSMSAEQILEVLSQGGTAVISNNVELTAVLNSSATIKLDGGTIKAQVFAESNGEILEGNTDSYAVWVKDGEVIIEGNGKIVAQDADYSMAVWAQGGTVIINGGTFENAGDGCDLIYASAGGKVIINDGIFKATEYLGIEPGTGNKHSALNIKNSDREISSITVYGGTFYGFNPADNISEGEGTNFVAEGYESIEIEPNIWKVVKK